jgi:hypothetical protein
MPERLKIKLVVSTQQIKIEPLSKIINNINDRLIFLYKNFVPPISDADVIIFDYNNFIYDSLESQLSNEDYSYILHLFDIKDIQFKNQSERENINSINKYLVEIVKKHRLAFVVLNSFNVYVIANSLLKLGLKSKAIPWKIKDVDSEDPQHIFIGIDLGHNHRNKSSNLTIAVIDNFGCLLQKRTWKNLKADEVISYENLLEGFNWILTKLSKPIDRITIHRDGLITQNELEYFHQVMEKVKIENYNLVEVEGVALNTTENSDGHSNRNHHDQKNPEWQRRTHSASAWLLGWSEHCPERPRGRSLQHHYAGYGYR